jgi:hypothetical protein
MIFSLHFAVTVGSKRFQCLRELDYIPAPGERLWVDGDGFSGEVVIDSEYGHRSVEDDKTHVYLYTRPTQYDD